MQRNASYVRGVPRGLGVYIPPAVERIASSSFIWRLLNQPDYWVDGGWSQAQKQRENGYLCTLPTVEWDEEARHAASASLAREAWLMGQDAQARTHPGDASDFSYEWSHAASGVMLFPGVRVGSEGFKWLNAYLEYGGRIPEAWHVHIAGEWPKWLRDYLSFAEWMRKRGCIRPVVVSGVHASSPQRSEAIEILDRLDGALLRYSFLSAVLWHSVYVPDSWGSSMIACSAKATSLGRSYCGTQRRWWQANERAPDPALVQAVVGI